MSIPSVEDETTQEFHYVANVLLSTLLVSKTGNNKIFWMILLFPFSKMSGYRDKKVLRFEKHKNAITVIHFGSFKFAYRWKRKKKLWTQT